MVHWYEVPDHHKRGRESWSLLCSDDTYVKRVGLGKEVQPGLRMVRCLLPTCQQEQRPPMPLEVYTWDSDPQLPYSSNT